MKSESHLIALARNLMTNGYTEDLARENLVERFPEDEGTILTMNIMGQPVVETLVEPILVDEVAQVEVDSTPAVEEVTAPAPAKPKKSKAKSKAKKNDECIETPAEAQVVEWVEQEAQADENALIQNVLSQPVEVQTAVASALIAALPDTVLNELLVKIKASVVKPIFPPKAVKVPNSNTKAGRARILFLEAEDRSVKALSDLFMDKIGWVRGDANYYAKQFIAEFEAGKLK